MKRRNFLQRAMLALTSVMVLPITGAKRAYAQMTGLPFWSNMRRSFSVSGSQLIVATHGPHNLNNSSVLHLVAGVEEVSLNNSTALHLVAGVEEGRLNTSTALHLVAGAETGRLNNSTALHLFAARGSENLANSQVILLVGARI